MSTAHSTPGSDAQASRRWSLEDIPDLTFAIDKASVFDFRHTTVADSGLVAPDSSEASSIAGDEWAYLLSQTYYGERFAVQVCQLLLDRLPPAHAAIPLIEALLADESLHCEAISQYLRERLRNFVPQAESFRRACETALDHPGCAHAATALCAIVEPLGGGSVSASLRGVLDPVCTNLLSRLMRDEAEHIRMSRHLLQLIGTPPRDELHTLVYDFAKAMRIASCYAATLAPTRATGEAARMATRRAMSGPVLQRHAKFGGAAFLRTVREVPALASLGEALRAVFSDDEEA